MKRTRAKERVLEHLRQYPLQTVDQLQLATLTKSTTLHCALHELLNEGLVRRRCSHKQHYYSIR